MNESEKVWTVSEINRLIKEILDQTFYPFRIRGEISNLTIHRSGHVYFSLKDKSSQLSAVYFRAASIARDLELKNGMAIEVDGRVTVYEVRGTCQVIVNRITPQGTGELQKQFEELKQKLRDQGLFDQSRKRPIPRFPRRVGVVTSLQGAAIRDFCRILDRRFADLHIRIYPAAVQGGQAAGQIAAGIGFFNHDKSCDVIVLTRGGGSLEDLWPFNQEEVARAIAGSAIPVISAVGHEIDYTISDFVADLRVPTPSAAAELVVQEKSRLREQVTGGRDRIIRAFRLQISELRRRLERASRAAALRDPRNRVQRWQQKVDELTSRIQLMTERKTSDYNRRLETLQGRLQALSPRQVLERGYAIVMDDQGKTVKQATAVRPNQELQTILASGRLKTLVTEVVEN